MNQQLILEFLRGELDYLDSQLRWLWDTLEQAKAKGDADGVQFWEQAFLSKLNRYENVADQITQITQETILYQQNIAHRRRGKGLCLGRSTIIDKN